jgi:trans-aconitate 2-methyltransferase
MGVDQLKASVTAVALVPDPARLEPGAQLEAFLGTVVLGSVLDALPAARKTYSLNPGAAALR